MKPLQNLHPDLSPPQRANEPGLYECACGETLSGPAELYECPWCVPEELARRAA